jgi:hypothetical protein
MTERRRISASAAAALLPVLLAAAPAGAAPPITAEQAITNYQRSFDTGSLVECRRTGEGDEIVVCGRSGRPDPNRVPLPDEHEPGARVALLPGEPPRAVDALGAGSALSCSAVGRNPSCNGGLNVFQAVKILGKAFKALTGRE